MIREDSDFHIAERYLHLLGGGVQARLALLACSAALRLDDDVAREAVELVAQTNGSTDTIVGRIKRLGCVWRQADGTWYLTEAIRTYMADRLEAEVPAPVRQRLRELLAERADHRLVALSPDGPLTAYRARATKIEAAYQKSLTPGRADEGGREFGDLWHQSIGSAKNATAEAVAHLAPEIEARVRRLPDEILFLRGMTAYQRKQLRIAERDFRVVYENGRPGEIYAIAAHLFGNMVQDRKVAEKALRDSISWRFEPEDKSQVWHSLGNLLSKDNRRWREAESAYQTSLKLWDKPEHQGQVWHSLGNLLSKDNHRWPEAENAYRTSLKLRHKAADLGQSWHSLGNLFKRQGKLAEAERVYQRSFELLSDSSDRGQVRASWADALIKLGGTADYNRVEAYALESRRLDPENPKTVGIANRVLADLYEKRGELGKAIEHLEALLETNRRLNDRRHQQAIQERIDRLRKRIDSASKSGG